MDDIRRVSFWQRGVACSHSASDFHVSSLADAGDLFLCSPMVVNL